MAKNTETTTSIVDVTQLNEVYNAEIIKDNGNHFAYHTRSNPPVPQKMTFSKGPKTQIAQFDNSPQEVLARHGMYQDDSIYKDNPSAIYADISGFPDLQEHMNSFIELQNKFVNMPIEVRARFNHNILNFANYIKDGDVNSEDFIKGLMTDSDFSALKKNKELEKIKKEDEDFLLSDEYKALVAEQSLFTEYQRENYENWKKNRKQ